MSYRVGGKGRASLFRPGAHKGHRGAHAGSWGGFGSDKIPKTPPAGNLDAPEDFVGVIHRQDLPNPRPVSLGRPRGRNWPDGGSPGAGDPENAGMGRELRANGSFFWCWDFGGLRDERGGRDLKTVNSISYKLRYFSCVFRLEYFAKVLGGVTHFSVHFRTDSVKHL